SEEGALVGSAVNYFRALRSVYTQTEQQLGELLNGPDTPQVNNVKKLKKGGQFLSIALAVAGLNLAGCGDCGAAGAVSTQSNTSNVARQVIFGLSPELNQEEREQVFRAAGDLALRGLPTGGSLE